MRAFVRNEIPRDMDPRLVKILRDMSGYLEQVEKGFGSIQRGEKPVAGGSLPSQQLVDETKFVLLAGRNGGQSVKGSPAAVGSTGVTVLELMAYNDATAANMRLDNTIATIEASQLIGRAPSHTDQPLLIGFGTTLSPVINYAGVTITGVLSVAGVPSADNYAFGVQHSNLPTTSVTAFVQKRAAQTGNLFEWRTGGTPMSYIRASDGAFVGPFVGSGSDVHPDDIFRIVDNADNTKSLAHEVSGITTGTTRTWTAPDFDGTVALFRSNKLRIGDTTAPSHTLELIAGTTTVAPILFTNGTLLTTPVAGAFECGTNILYFTSATGPQRKLIPMKTNSTTFFVNRIPYAPSTGAELEDSSSFTFNNGTKVFTVIGTVQATGASSKLISQGTLAALDTCNFGNQAKDTVSKVQSDYTDTSTGTVNVVGIGGLLRVANSASSNANFMGFDGGVRVQGETLTQTGVGLGAVGLRGLVVVNAGSVTFPSVTALNGLVYTEGGTATITSAYAVASRWSHLNGTITNAYGFYAQDPAGGGTLTNNYMLYLENPTAGGTINRAIYSAGGASILAGTVRIGDTTAPTHRLELAAGSTTIAPLKLASGTSLTTAVAGVIEMTTDDLFFTITTGTARKAFILDDGARLTSGKIPVATTNGRLVDLTASAAYTPTNVTTDRSYDANATTVDELADVLGTVIADLQAKGILG